MKYAFFGLGFVQGWLWLYFLNGPLLFSETVGWGKFSGIIFISFLMANSLTYLFLTWKPVAPLYSKNQFLILSAILMVFGIIIVGLSAGQAGEINKLFIALIGTLVAGFGSAILITAIGELFSLFSDNVAGLSFACAVTIGTVLFFLLQKLDIHTSLLLTALLPIAALLFIYLARKLLLKINLETGQSSLKRFPFTRKLVFLIIIVYFTGGLLYKIQLLSLASSLQQSYWLTNIIYCLVIIIAGSALYFFSNINFSILYRPVLPLLGAGFMLLPFFNEGYIFLPLTLLQAGFALFDLYTWLLFTYTAKYHQRPAYVFGWGMFFITMSIFTGEILYTTLFAKLFVFIREINIISLFAALLMLAGTMLFQDNHNNFTACKASSDLLTTASGLGRKKPGVVLSDELSASLDRDETEKANYQDNEFSPDKKKEREDTDFVNHLIYDLTNEGREQFVTSLELTKREKEVALLLLEGRNNPYIRSSMNISNNTLKTHLRNIYRKAMINDRQELLDLFNQYSKSYDD